MNIILITVDCLRADHLSCLGYTKKTTPNLDKIARDGVLFTNAFSYGSMTATSMVPMLTSTSVVLHYLHGFCTTKTFSENENLMMYREVVKDLIRLKPTIAGVLNRHGYETAAFHSNPFLSKYYGFGKGFSHFDDSFRAHTVIKHSELREKFRVALTKNRRLFNLARRVNAFIFSSEVPYERGEVINEKVLSWFVTKKPEKFFVWIHYMDTHVPYKPLKDFRPQISSLEMSSLYCKMVNPQEDVSDDDLSQIIELYDGNVRYTDYSIKHLLDELDDKKILDDTAVLITADHGDEFKEHGGFIHPPSKLYDELIHVPLIIYNSGYVTTIDEPVSLIDIAPTITDLLNLPNVKTFQGKSLIRVIKGMGNYGIVSEGLEPESGKMVVAYRTKGWKCILDEVRNRKELYNLEEDPKETNNLYEVKRDIAEDLESKILAHISHQRKSVAMDIERERIRRRIKGKERKL